MRRELVGEASTPLPQLTLDFGTDRCAQLRDVIPAGTLGEGRYRYRVLDEADDPLAELEFFVPPPSR